MSRMERMEDFNEEDFNEEDFNETVARLTSVIAVAIGDFTNPNSNTMEIFAALMGAFAYFAGKHSPENRKELVRRLKANIPTVEMNIETCARMNAEGTDTQVSTPSMFGH